MCTTSPLVIIQDRIATPTVPVLELKTSARNSAIAVQIARIGSPGVDAKRNATLSGVPVTWQSENAILTYVKLVAQISLT